jgi:transposase
MPQQKSKSPQPVLPGYEDLFQNQARLPALGSASPLCGNSRANATRKARPQMDIRQQRGLEIAALHRINRKGEIYIVPSQSNNGQYKVKLGPDDCNCLDFQSNKTKCKHVFAVEYMLQRENGKAAPLPEGVVPLRAKNYTQNWPSYRLAQINEKAKLQQLLYELCSGIDEPIQTMGRSRIPMADMIFSAAYKVYSQLSSRRFMTDLREAHARRYISKLPCYNTVNNYIEMEELTPYLQWLIIQSSLPLKAVETDFAADASGFSTCQYVRWYDEKYGKEQSEKDWVKAHIMCGLKTNIITAAEVSGAFGSDHNYFAPLFNETAKRFNVREVSGDKAFSSYANLRLVESKGATPYIDFKDNAVGTSKCEVWNRMYHYYNLHRAEFMSHYHKRPNVESTFSMVKAKFGGFIRAKLPAAQTNEVLLKILCHNVCCLIQSTFELGITVEFWPEQERAAVFG